MNGMFDYNWYVYESGYEITNIDIDSNEYDLILKGRLGNLSVMPNINFTKKAKHGARIVPHIIPKDISSPVRSYKLMDHPGLFQEFGNLDSESKMIEFANRYGLLQKPFSKGDSLIFLWAEQIKVMYFLITAHELIKKGNAEKLEALTTVDFDKEYALRRALRRSKPEDYFVNHYLRLKINIVRDGSNYAITLPFYNRDKRDIDLDLKKIPQMGKVPPKNRSEALYNFICALLNRQLKNAMSIQTTLNSRSNGTEMTAQPKDLISALWLQFAHYVSRNLEFKQCADCSNFFEVKSKKRRFEKKYCSDRCRTRVAARNRRNKK